MIELQDVHKVYTVGAHEFIALKNINLAVQAGEIYGIIGKSGAGKSTLIRCINLLERPTRGNVIVAGQSLTTLAPAALRQARRHIGMIFQHFNLLTTRTVYQNIALPLELEGHSKQEIATTVEPLLELTHLKDKKNSYPAQLSGGQKQRVAIARALACQPKVLLCDEATSALDLHTTKSILELLKNINDQLNLTILLITHEMEVVKEICDRVAIIDHGEILEEDTIFDFFAQPKTDLAKEFIRTALKQELPDYLKKCIQSIANEQTNPVLRIIFFGKTAVEPFIAHLMQEIGITLNILQANIEVLHHGTLGIMVVEAINNNGKLQAALSYLQQKNIKAEIIGHVPRTIF